MPLDLATLARQGVSANLAAHYAEVGWLVRLGQGVYAFPADELSAHGAIKFLQNRVAGLHVAGKSALALQGVRHNLASREQLVLWGGSRFRHGSPRAFPRVTYRPGCSIGRTRRSRRRAWSRRPA